MSLVSSVRRSVRLQVAVLSFVLIAGEAFAETPPAFFAQRCFECHNDATQEGGLNLKGLAYSPAEPENFARWVKIHDRIVAGEMPPKDAEQPSAEERAATITWLRES